MQRFVIYTEATFQLHDTVPANTTRLLCKFIAPRKCCASNFANGQSYKYDLFIYSTDSHFLAVSGIKWDCLMKTYPFAAKPCLKALSA